MYMYFGNARSIFSGLVLLLLMVGCAKPVSLTSPEGKLIVSVCIDSSGRLSYNLQLNGKTIIASSALGITVNKIDMGQGVEIGTPAYSEVNEKYTWKGVHNQAINHYRQAVIPIRNIKSGIWFRLEIRVFNDGLAFRYVVPGHGSSLVNGEASSWKIPDSSRVWYQENVYYYEGLHYIAKVTDLVGKKFGPPLTFQTPDSLYGCITEAALYNYSGMSLTMDSNDILQAGFVNDTAGWKIRDTVVSPWRVVLASSDLNGLVNSDIISDLNPSPDSIFRNADWIKPGRAVWSYFEHENVTTLALEKAYVEKASRLGFEYSIVDAGWETSWPNSMDSLEALVEFARERKVGIFVWKSYADLKDDTFRRNFFHSLHKIGVQGVKIDFIDKEGIDQIRFYENALKDAAVARLMINFHGADKPTGYDRRFPNEITREGIYGQEWRTYNLQGPANNATIPFTRFLAGPGDYTPVVFNSSNAYGTSRTHQVALPIIYNSPLMCWADNPDTFLRSPAASIIRAIPTIWDETLVLPPSRIGQVAAFARRKGADWFVGMINAGEEKQFTLSLEFLGKGNFQTEILQDDFTNSNQFFHTLTNLSFSDSLHVVMKPDGGFVAMFKKTNHPLPVVSIIPAGGYLDAPVRVQMTSAADLQIRYSTDGSEPNIKSSIYNKSFIVDRPLLIRATAFSGEKPIESTAIAQFLPETAPLISPTAGIFIDSQRITISTKQQEGIIRYTLDGSEPDESSAFYQYPLKLASSAIVKAKFFFRSGTVSATTTQLFKRVPSLKSSPTINAIPGLTYSYYEGKWVLMPDFSHLRSKKQGIVSVPDLEVAASRKEFYALQFRGYIDIPVKGVYSFYILSDDGSQLFIDNKKTVDNDGCHGDLEKSADQALAAGKHECTLNYFQNGSGQDLQIYIKGPGLEKQKIPSQMFFHRRRQMKCNCHKKMVQTFDSLFIAGFHVNSIFLQ